MRKCLLLTIADEEAKERREHASSTKYQRLTIVCELLLLLLFQFCFSANHGHRVLLLSSFYLTTQRSGLLRGEQANLIL
jgi:uncharacterized membrane protein